MARQKRNIFRQAVAYARSIINDPLKKAEYKQGLLRGKTVYHAAITEYLKEITD